MVTVEAVEAQRLRAAPSTLRRVVAISVSLVGTQAVTNVFGLAFWGFATRRFSIDAVGVAGAAIALMTLLSTLGSMGLGSLLIARLPHTAISSRRGLVRTALGVTGAASAVLALVVPLVAIHGFGSASLLPITGSPGAASLFVAGTALAGVALVLDQAVLVLGNGSLQLERNSVASATKVAALAGLALGGLAGGVTGGISSGMVIFGAWAAGNLVSLAVVARRSRGGRAADERRFIDLSTLRGQGRAAAAHHALNLTLMAPLMILPLIVTVMVSSAANGIFTTALQIAGPLYALPFAVALALFAASEGRAQEVRTRMRQTVPFGLGFSLAANAALFPLAPLVMSIFGPIYREQGSNVLRVMAAAGLVFVIKDHYVTLRRVQGRTRQATGVLLAFTGVELGAAVVGARAGGVLGLSVGWVGASAAGALILGAVLLREMRSPAADPADPAIPAIPAIPAVPADPAVPAVPAEPAVPAQPDGPRRSFGSGLTIPVALVLMAAGLFSIALAVQRGRDNDLGGVSQALFVAGLLAIFVPAAVGVLLPGTSRTGLIVLATAMPVALQLSRIVLYPTRFMFHDEYLHANTLRLIDVTGHLFSLNPLLPITSYYPGLEIATNGVQSLTGLSPHTSGQVVLLAARVVLALGIVLLIERLTGSARAGAVAGVIYACNPQYLFFNSQFSYQTIALPLTILTVYLMVSRRTGARWSLVLPLLAVTATVFSHHITAALLLAALFGWAVIEKVLHRGRAGQARPILILALAGTGAFALSLANPGNTLASYIGAIMTSSGQSLRLLAQGKQNKQIFQNTAGVGTAQWEQILVIASLVIVVLVLMPSLLWARRWIRLRASLAVLLCLTALLYPLVPAGHITRSTAEVGDRAAGFVFVGVAFVVACWLCRGRMRAVQTALFAVAASVTFVGSLVLGAGPIAAQLPGPFQVAADARSMDAANLAAAQWIRENLPAESRVYADRDTGLLAAADGGQFTVRHISTGIDASRLLLAPDFGAADRDLIRRAGIRYVIADQRDAFGLPNQAVYIESGEYGEQGRTAPVPAAALEKFDAVPGVDRLYDNGAVVVYDVGRLDAAP